MKPQSFTKPFYIFFILLPYGISVGFATVTLPYLLRQNEFTVETTAFITAIGVSAALWRFLFGPIVDLTFSLRKWYGLSLLLCISSLLALCFTPFTIKGELLLIIFVFISQIAANILMLPVGGIMANRIATNKKGMASGWFQAGNLGGVGLGGGAGLWIATHYNVHAAGIVLCIASLLCALPVLLIEDIKYNKENTILSAIAKMLIDIFSMLKVPIILFVVLMLCMPIGTGAASNLWSAIASDWHVNANTVALITGAISGIASIIGCIAGGFISDKWGNWIGYFGSGIFCALITVGIAMFPYQPMVYIIGVLLYNFGMGLINAAFSSVILYAIGKHNAATKYALLSSLGNLPVVYMTSIDGWAHDKYNSKSMLSIEAAAGILFVLISVIVLNRMKSKNLVPAIIE
jgi:MFS family permease